MIELTHQAGECTPLTRGAARDETSTAPGARPGYAMAEAVLAFAILGIALAGLAPFVVTQLRLIHKLENRFQGVVTLNGQPFNQTTPAPAYYCVPWKNPRMRRLFGRGTVTTDPTNAADDYTSASSSTQPKNTLTIFYATGGAIPVPYYSQTLTWPDFLAASDPNPFTVYLDVVPNSQQ